MIRILAIYFSIEHQTYVSPALDVVNIAIEGVLCDSYPEDNETPDPDDAGEWEM